MSRIVWIEVRKLVTRSSLSQSRLDADVKVIDHVHLTS